MGVAPGESIDLAVGASDADSADSLSFQWSAGSGQFHAPTAAATTWTAGAVESAETLVVQVRDSRGAVASIQLAVAVSAANGKGSARVTAAVNTWPLVDAVVATPVRIDAGQSTLVSVTAGDADGDALAYAWTASCEGAFDAPSSASTHFTLSALPADGSCSLTVAVTDPRGGHNSGTVILETGPGVQPNIAPQLELAFQSSEAVAGGEAVVLEVQAVDPEGGVLQFAWQANLGSLSVSVLSS